MECKYHTLLCILISLLIFAQADKEDWDFNPDGVKIQIAFIHPKLDMKSTAATSIIKLPSTYTVKFELIFTNQGKADYKLNTVHASLRDAIYHGNYLQNFTSTEYNKISSVHDENNMKHLGYNFRPHGSLADLEDVYLYIKFNYEDDFTNGKQYQLTYRWKVSIVKLKDGLKDGFKEYNENEMDEKLEKKRTTLSSLDVKVEFANKKEIIPKSILKAGTTEFEISFMNSGPKDFLMQSLLVSFHNPENFDDVYHNFAPRVITNEAIVKPNQKKVKFYPFSSQGWNGYHVQLHVRVAYRPAEKYTQFPKSDVFFATVFNGTVYVGYEPMPYTPIVLTVFGILGVAVVFNVCF